MIPDPRKVTVVRAAVAEYPADPPFDPSEAYPEYPGTVASSPNAVYAAVRDAFRRGGLDAAGFATAESRFGIDAAVVKLVDGLEAAIGHRRSTLSAAS
ncbi:MAG: hypothetical protein WD773_04995 [Gemmatimonadales bacterium]